MAVKIIYEDKDNYIVEPIENGGIINIFIHMAQVLIVYIFTLFYVF